MKIPKTYSHLVCTLFCPSLYKSCLKSRIPNFSFRVSDIYEFFFLHSLFHFFVMKTDHLLYNSVWPFWFQDFFVIRYSLKLSYLLFSRKIDILSLGCYTKFLCSLIKWCSQLSKITIPPLPYSLPSYRMNIAINVTQ